MACANTLRAASPYLTSEIFMLNPRYLVFVDGENLTIRYQAMVNLGRHPMPHVVHIPDVLVWSNRIVEENAWYLLRIAYYTSAVGDDLALAALAEQIKAIRYTNMLGFGFLNPHIFKKQKRGDKTKSVDINLVTDLLRHTYNDSIQEVLILTGDGDYLPAIQEAMRQGIRVNVGAFSSGLDPRLRTRSDEFIDLDEIFFAPMAKG